MKSPVQSCQVCGGSDLRHVDGYSDLVRITSDCRPFRAGGVLAVCLGCGSVQKAMNSQWLSEIAEIYSDYAAYYQSGGSEQIVFDRRTGLPRRRSDVLVEYLAGTGQIAREGSLVDVGCGNGVTLKALARVLPGWKLSGFEMSDANSDRLRAIPNFCRLYTSSIDNVDQCFDLVTMIHSLEHFSSPGETLSAIKSRMCPKHLFVEVCNIERNPFDILVADHLMHFSPSTLALLARRSGFVPNLIEQDWVPKEISLLARIGNEGEDDDPLPLRESDPAVVYQQVAEYVRWLGGLRDAAIGAAKGSCRFGMFGTSIASTWLAAQLEEKVSFFVDEDLDRVGRSHRGCPVMSPGDIPRGAVVFVGLAPAIAEGIAERLRNLPCTFVLPPPIIA